MCGIVVFFVLVCTLAACTSEPQQAAQVPTLAVLPSETPQPTATATPTLSPTPDALGTQIAVGQMTNEAAQVTLVAMWTQSVASPTPSLTITPTQSATPRPTYTPTSMPTSTAEQIAGCDITALASWMAELSRISSRETPDELQEIRQYYAEVAWLPYPQCAQPARESLMESFDELLLAYEAMERNDISAINTHQANSERAINEFSRLADQLVTVATYNSNPSNTQYSVGSGGTGILCNDGTWSYAENRQGACSGHGGVYEPLPVYSGGGGIVCRDGTVSSSSTRRGACSHHGGIR